MHYTNLQADEVQSINKTIIGWLNHGFKEYANLPAVNFKDEELSYKELDKLSNRIAHFLIHHGVRKGDRVGICLDRSMEMIACMIGILKAGASYVPLDPNYPVERLKIMRTDADLRLLIIHELFFDKFENTSQKILTWTHINESLDRYPDIPPNLHIKEEDVVYVIFTSGSTGRPKGIEMPHRALSNLIEWQLKREYFRKEARVIQYSSISFDVSFQEIVSTFASGGTLFLVKDEERRDPRVLLELINHLKIERLFIPFVALRSLVEVAMNTHRLPQSLKEIITAGEQLRVDTSMRQFFRKLPGTILENQYGPSETHVISAHLLDEDPSKWPELPPIGKAITNNSILILDENMQRVDEGKIGELYLAGRNLALGYLGRDDLTKKSFIKVPLYLDNHSVLYKTGDLGLRNEDGAIEFLGRSDHQIKIRGYRVEPGEINSVGAEYPGIAHCLTHTFTDHAGKPKLISYYVPKRGIKIDGDGFMSHLAASLPEYMVPTFVKELDKIPYTPSGKVDFKALPKPQPQLAGTDETITYQSETEAQLAGIWSRLLGYQHIPRSA
ncbi:MAG TPA: amino acid adenylation domain-containing protein, partial [Balneolaceae bacterium]|nr:amino acid adenylation domain-containing protein [Balneolaceae bacterium]